MTELDGVHGTVCNEQQYNQYNQSLELNVAPSISCLTHGESIGLALASEASFISSVSIIVIFIWIGWNVRWYRRRFPDGDWRLFQGPADVYMFSLFLFDFLQAMGGVLDARWAHDGIVTTGHYCTAQGIIQQFGEVGVALITLFLAVHTFVAALWRVGLQARGVAFGMVCLACLFNTLWVAIGAAVNKNYDTPTPYWCWISPDFSGIRLGGEYIWLWIALFASAILYVPLYFWTEGRLSVDEERWYKLYLSHPGDQMVGYAQRRAALGMLLYPVAYSLVVLPTSISRWLQFRHHHVSSAATFFGVITFNLSGAINVLLFLIVRPQLLLFPRPEELAVPELELAPQRTGSAIFSDIAKFQHSPEPTSVALADEGPRNGMAQSHVSSRRISDDI